MIYLQNTSEGAHVLFVPKNGATPEGDLVFRAKSTIDLDVEINQIVIDLKTSDQYYNLGITFLDGLPSGEYEYTLMVGNTLLSSGLLVLGENSIPSEYNKDIQYEQYTTE